MQTCIRPSLALSLTLVACAAGEESTFEARTEEEDGLAEEDDRVRILVLGDSISSGLTQRDADRTNAAKGLNLSPRASFRPILATYFGDWVRFVGPTEYASRGLAHGARRGWAISSYFPSTRTDADGNPVQRGSDPDDREATFGANDLHGWATYEPQIVISLLGINDYFSNHAIRTRPGGGFSVEQGYRRILDKLRDNATEEPSFYLAEIYPTKDGSEDVSELNAVVREIEAESDDVVAVDQHTGFQDSFYADNIHPSPEGDRYLATNWCLAIRDEVLAMRGLRLGDFNTDGAVDFADFQILSAHFEAPASRYVDGDLDCDGYVDFADFLVFTAEFDDGA